jgi:GNAT superfamily N-acetyltransferase
VSLREEVRIAGPGDLADVVRMLSNWVDTTPAARAGHLFGFPRRRAEPDLRVQAALTAPDQRVFVGTLDNITVGFALVRIDDSMPGGRLAVVDELFVEPEAREVGLGEALLDSCVKWASECGCSGIEVDALPGARSAKNLAERSGFTARRLTMHRKIE